MGAYIIGVDTGGTFTDVSTVDENGKVIIGKSSTIPERLEDGVINAVDDAAQASGLN